MDEIQKRDNALIDLLSRRNGRDGDRGEENVKGEEKCFKSQNKWDSFAPAHFTFSKSFLRLMIDMSRSKFL